MNRKFCSHDCYVRSRHSKSQGSVVAQEEERNIGWLSQARSTIEDTGIHEAGQQEPRKQISRSELAEYQKNSYVRVDLQKSDIILTDAFFIAAQPFKELPISEILRIFEVDERHLGSFEINKISDVLNKGKRTKKGAGVITPMNNDTTLRIAMNRMMVLDYQIESMLQQVKILVGDMTCKERKELCLMLERFSKDPIGKYTKEYLAERVGISRNSYYKYINRERYGLSPGDRDRLDEKYVRMAYDYKGYPKGVRMVYMLIPRLTEQNIGLDRVRRIMRKYDMYAGLREPNPTKVEAQRRLKESRKPNLLRRMFKLYRPNEVRLTDVTVIYCAGKLDAYGSALIDPVTGVLVAFDVSENNDLDLAMTTLHNADKHPCKDGGTLHSDQGVLYLSPEFQAEVETMGMTQSMSRRGNCWDNAPQESFFGHFKDDCQDKYMKCRTIQELRKVIEEYAYYYNYERGMWDRKHMTPIEYEAYLLSLSDEEYVEYREREMKRYINMKEDAKRKAIERNRNEV